MTRVQRGAGQLREVNVLGNASSDVVERGGGGVKIKMHDKKKRG